MMHLPEKRERAKSSCINEMNEDDEFDDIELTAAALSSVSSGGAFGGGS